MGNKNMRTADFRKGFPLLSLRVAVVFMLLLTAGLLAGCAEYGSGKAEAESIAENAINENIKSLAEKKISETQEETQEMSEGETNQFGAMYDSLVNGYFYNMNVEKAEIVEDRNWFEYGDIRAEVVEMTVAQNIKGIYELCDDSYVHQKVEELIEYEQTKDIRHFEADGSYHSNPDNDKDILFIKVRYKNSGNSQQVMDGSPSFVLRRPNGEWRDYGRGCLMNTARNTGVVRNGRLDATKVKLEAGEEVEIVYAIAIGKIWLMDSSFGKYDGEDYYDLYLSSEYLKGWGSTSASDLPYGTYLLPLIKDGERLY